jgi:hypothetical protein
MDEEILKRRIGTLLDNALIWIGDAKDERRKHDYRLHPMYAKDMVALRDLIVKALAEE